MSTTFLNFFKKHIGKYFHHLNLRDKSGILCPEEITLIPLF